MIKDDLPLVHALIDAFLLLESSGPDEVNADTAGSWVSLNRKL